MATFRIHRHDPDAASPSRVDEFDVPTERGMPVLKALIHIFENLDHSLAYRASCGAALCGSCAMHINGRYRLACQTLIDDVARNDTVEIRPLNHLPVIRDLVVDMSGFMEQWRRVRPYLISSRAPPERENLQTAAQREKLDGLVDCIMCGACYSACPSALANSAYLGPHAMLRALRFIEDTRDEAAEERLTQVASDEGVFRCHTAFNCQTVCPKDLDPAGAIVRIRRLSLTGVGTRGEHDGDAGVRAPAASQPGATADIAPP